MTRSPDPGGQGPAATLEDFDRGIRAEVARRHRRFRAKSRHVIAIDTNVPVTLIAKHAAYCARARALFEKDGELDREGILPEAVCRLRAVDEFRDAAVARAIDSARAIPAAHRSPRSVVQALTAAADGLSVADTQLVGSTPTEAEAFVTFDEACVPGPTSPASGRHGAAAPAFCEDGIGR